MRDKLTGDQATLSGELAAAKTDLDNLVALSNAVALDVINATVEVEAYRAGSQLYVSGFVFPVAGEVEFIDSWGYPRMSGTSQAHWHQGTDIMAKMGTPLVASESGTLTKIGPAGLGGNRLWVKGDSGTDYYYAHLVVVRSGRGRGQAGHRRRHRGLRRQHRQRRRRSSPPPLRGPSRRRQRREPVSAPQGGVRLEAHGEGRGRSRPPSPRPPPGSRPQGVIPRGAGDARWSPRPPPRRPGTAGRAAAPPPG